MATQVSNAAVNEVSEHEQARMSSTMWSPSCMSPTKSPPISFSNSAKHSPPAWTTKPINQQVTYPCPPAVTTALTQLENLPPLVTPTEIHRLKRSLRDVALGKAFLLQGGDCAELFSYCTAARIDSKIKLLLRMSLILLTAIDKPIVRIARMAGQYAKPRSSPMETLADGTVLPSFRGDILNAYTPDVASRQQDPDRLVQAYFHSAATLNHIRAQLASGIADLHRPMDWNLGHVRDATLQAKYQRIVDRITDSLRFLKTVGASGGGDGGGQELSTVDLYTSHEGLLLEYEQSLVRRLPDPVGEEAGGKHEADERATKSSSSGFINGTKHSSYHSQAQAQPTTSSSYYATSAHFLWIGDRTRAPTHAHVEFFRGIANPIGVKIGPTTTQSDLTTLLHLLDPHNEPGKITLITRYGARKIASLLPSHIAAVQSSGHLPVWQCDPMHGNTTSLPAPNSGVKTRAFEDILEELRCAIRIHRECGSVLGGVHLELTGEAVTECTGGGEELGEGDLSERYETFCDPRLNERQALELAFAIGGEY